MTESLDNLGATVKSIVDGLPGRLKQLTVRSGECSIDVSWHADEPTGYPDFIDEIAEPVSDVRSIVAPMVGTYYSRPGPDAPAFVDIGDVVEPGDQVALLEAMKLFTPLLADRRGKIGAIHVADGDMVEFGQVLLEILPVD